MNPQTQNFTPDEAIAIVTRFNEALNARDAEAMMRLMTPDCVFENTYPAPDGTRFEGHQAVRTFWEGFFHESTRAAFEIEDIFGTGNRCVMLWKYRWVDQAGKSGHIRGVDVYTLRAGLIAQKLSYVKG